MILSPQNLTMFRGSTRQITVSVKDNENAAVDLTGATIEFFAARSTENPPDIYKTVGSGVEISSPATAGVFVVTLSAADTANLNGDYYYQGKVKDQLNNISIVVHGTLTFKKQLKEA